MIIYAKNKNDLKLFEIYRKRELKNFVKSGKEINVKNLLSISDKALKRYFREREKIRMIKKSE